MAEPRIPQPVIAVVGDVLGSYYFSHTKLNTLLQEIGAPGDPPEGNCIAKVQTWLKRANDAPGIDALALLGRLLGEFFAREHPPGTPGAQGVERIERTLQKCALAYVPFGRVEPLQTMEPKLPMVGRIPVLPPRREVIIPQISSSNQANPRDVFLVHGRNTTLNEAMFTFLTSVDLRPIEWEEMVRRTGKASPYVGEVLKAGFNAAQAVVVLFTGDDQARLDSSLVRPDDSHYERHDAPQPRPNVLIEAGMALGIAEERTVLVEIGRLRAISDLLGRHVVRLDNSPESRKRLINRLQVAGCHVNDGGERWLRAGSFGS
jgi:predicted nucleotide-binding protein